MTFNDFMARVSEVVIQPILLLAFGVAFLIFVWGIVQYIHNGDDAKSREEGQRSILWGLVGMVIMISVFGIINIIQGTIGVKKTPGQTKIQEQFRPTLDRVPKE